MADLSVRTHDVEALWRYGELSDERCEAGVANPVPGVENPQRNSIGIMNARKYAVLGDM